MSNRITWTEQQLDEWKARQALPLKLATLPHEDVQAKPKPKAKRIRVPRTRNGGTWTNAAYFGRLRSALRKAFQWWKPAQDALRAAKVGNGYVCAACKKVFPRKQIQIDHRQPCESLTQLDHLPQFVARLTCEGAENFSALCLNCHQQKTNTERKKP